MRTKSLMNIAAGAVGAVICLGVIAPAAEAVTIHPTPLRKAAVTSHAAMFRKAAVTSHATPNRRVAGGNSASRRVAGESSTKRRVAGGASPSRRVASKRMTPPHTVKSNAASREAVRPLREAAAPVKALREAAREALRPLREVQ